MFAGLTSRWDHAVRMRHEQAARHLHEDRQQLGGVHRAVELVEQVGERFARHVFHDEEPDAVVLVILEQRRDVGVRQIRGVACLGTQPAQFRFLVRRVGAQRLDGHWAPELDVEPFPHFAHAALREPRIKAVTAVNQLSFNESHCFNASFITAVMIGPAANDPYKSTLCTTTATAILGLSAGANPIVQPSIELLSTPICAVPVFAATRTPGISRFGLPSVTTASIALGQFLGGVFAERRAHHLRFRVRQHRKVAEPHTVHERGLHDLALVGHRRGHHGVLQWGDGVSPCPIEASASLSPAMFCGNREATARIGRPVESDPSIVIVESKPSFLAMSDTVSSPSATPSCANAVFDEYAMALLSEILPSEPSPSDDEFVTRSACRAACRRSRPGSANRAGILPDSGAAAATTVLNVDPGG